MAKEDLVVGLDVGHHAIKAAWARKASGGARIVRVETLRLPPDVSDVRSILAPWLEQLPLAQYPCALGIPGPHCMFQPFVLTPTDPRTLDQVASMEVLRFNEMASEQMAYAYEPISVNPGERRILLGMTRPGGVSAPLDLAKALSLRAVDILPAPVAMFRAGSAAQPFPQPRLHIHVGYAGTDVAVGSPGGLFFARSFGGGGQTFTEELARARNLSIGQAENLKIGGTVGVPDLAPAADRWMTELRACLSVYENLYPGHKLRPVSAILSGGGALLPGLAEFVAAQVRMDACVLSSLPGGPAVKNPAPFAVAAGLALAAAAVQPEGLSLLPGNLRNELTLRRQKPYWIASGFAAVLLLCISLGGGFLEIDRRKGQLDVQTASLQRRQELAARFEQVRAENARIQEMALPVKKLLRGAPLLRNLVSQVAAALSPNDQITLVCDADFYFNPQPIIAPPPPQVLRDRRRLQAVREKPIGEKGFERLIIEGYTRTANLSTVKELIAQLKSDYIASADLLRDDQAAAEAPAETAAAKHPGAKRFVIDIRLRSP